MRRRETGMVREGREIRKKVGGLRDKEGSIQSSCLGGGGGGW